MFEKELWFGTLCGSAGKSSDNLNWQMKFIDNIEIKNFKSIRDAKINDCKRVNIFIGYPNVGKSNILEALCLFCITHETKFTDFIRVKEDPTLFFNGFINNTIEITINGLFQISCKYSLGELQIVERYLEKYSNSEITFRTPTLKENYFRNFSFSRAKAPEATVPELNFKKYEFKKGGTKKITQYSSLDIPFGENIFSIIQTDEQIYEEASALLKDYGLELLYDSGLQAFTIFKRTDKGIFTVPYDLLADTLQRLIFYKTAILSNRDSVLLFEEPEAHMFPPYISKFTTAVIHDANENQFFIETHSPFVINDFMDNLKSEELAIYIVSFKKETGETQINRMSETDMHEAYQFGYDFFMNINKFISQEEHG
jgi:AAA15 family ATPase/GTPase